MRIIKLGILYHVKCNIIDGIQMIATMNIPVNICSYRVKELILRLFCIKRE